MISDSVLKWMSSNWFNFLQTFGIISTLLLTIRSNSRLIKSRRLTNYMQLTQFHRQIWSMAMENPSLYRVVSLDKELEKVDATQFEEQFITFLFLHTTCAFELAKAGEISTIEGMKFDVHAFLQAPMVRKFWEKKRIFYNSNFVKFVDSCLSPPHFYTNPAYWLGLKKPPLSAQASEDTPLSDPAKAS